MCQRHISPRPALAGQTLQVLQEDGKTATQKSYMWLYRTSGDAKRQIVIFEYQPDRKAIHPVEFLNRFEGYLHADGYAGYHNLKKEIMVIGCWTHAELALLGQLQLLQKPLVLKLRSNSVILVSN